MWCRQCRQDVPVCRPENNKPACCPRCGGKLVTLCAVEAARSITPEEAAASEYMSEVWRPELVQSPPLYDSWEIDEQMRHLERLLHKMKKTVDRSSPQNGAMRFDSPQSAVVGRHGVNFQKQRTAEGKTRRWDREPKKATRRRSFSVMQWLVSAVGTACLSCGAVLSAWSLFATRQELWDVGVPTLLAGQILLLTAWTLQVGRLSRDNRSAATQLNAMRRRLDKMRQLAK